MEKGHEDFRKRLLDHIVEHYNDEHMACQAATAMIVEYKHKFPDGFNKHEALVEAMYNWRKAKENKKDWEIDSAWGWIPPNGENLEDFRTITSIKRLSDNETFTVGDQILEGEIKAIKITECGTCYLKDEDWFVELKDAQKYVKPEVKGWIDKFSEFIVREIKDTEFNEELIKLQQKQIDFIKANTYKNASEGYEFGEYPIVDEHGIDNFNCSLIECSQLGKDPLIITKLQRLSDDEIFELGDKVTNPAGQSFVISKFYTNHNNTKLLCNGENTGAGHISIEKIQHYEEPELTPNCEGYWKQFEIVVNSPEFEERKYTKEELIDFAKYCSHFFSTSYDDLINIWKAE